MKARRRRVVWIISAALGAFVLFTVAKAVLTVAGDEELGTPSRAELLPLPDGASVAAERTLESQGSVGGGIRVLVVDTGPTGRPAADFPATYLDALADRGFRRPNGRAAVSEASGTCVTVDPADQYLADDERPETIKRWLQVLDPPIGTTAVVTASLC